MEMIWSNGFLTISFVHLLVSIKVECFQPHRFLSLRRPFAERTHVNTAVTRYTQSISNDEAAQSNINTSTTQIIPKELLFGNLEYRIPQISPDGKFVAYLAPNYNDGSCCYIHVRQAEEAEAEETEGQIATDTIICPDNRIHHFFWAEDSRTILYYANGDSIAGNEAFHLWAVDAISIYEQLKELSDPNLPSSPSIRKDFDYLSYIRDLTPGTNIKAKNVITNPNFEHLCFVATNQRDETLFDMYKCNIYTGELVLDTLNPGDVILWGSNVRSDKSSFEINYALVKSQRDASTTIRVRGIDCRDNSNLEEWRDLYTYPYGELGNFVAFCGDGKNCWITTSSERDKVALIKINLGTGRQVMSNETNNPIEFANEKSDVGEIVLDHNDNEVAMVSFNYARKKLFFYDEILKNHYLKIVNQGPVESVDEVQIISKSRDGLSWIVSYEPSDAPAYFVLYCTNSGKIKPLFCSQSRLLQYVKSMSAMEAVSITARDGMELVAYLSKPTSDTNKKKQWPLVLLVHGGPWERDYLKFNPIVQWLTNREYCVLSVNFRGSTGYGKKFLHSGDKQWGVGSMQHDLTDSVKWCIEQGIVDRKKICIFGSSYGGYACLSGLCFTPNLYKCGVDIAGPNNIKTLITSIPSYWAPLRQSMRMRIGPVDTDDEFNRKISPFFHVDQIVAPLLVVQGKNDPRVKEIDTEKMISLLKEKGKDIEYILFPDEGHNILRPLNRDALFHRIEIFLAKHLGGRCEVFEKD